MFNAAFLSQGYPGSWAIGNFLLAYQQRRGREHVWTINPRRLAEAQRHIDIITRGWDDALLRLKAHVEG